VRCRIPQTTTVADSFGPSIVYRIRVPVGELGLRKGKSIAYLFDFGDEWRLQLKVVDRWEASDESYPMLVEAEGVPSPQYPELDDESEEE
jgi:hypothetical protein